MARISGVYQIVNTITGDFYIGSSIDLKKRKKEHFSENNWKYHPNKLYKDMKQYGKDNFLFKPVWLCNPEDLRKYEQLAIEKYNPKYNIRVAYTGLSKEEYDKKRYKEKVDSIKQQQKQYRKKHTDSKKQYDNQQCLYKNEILTLCALKARFIRQGIEHPTLEAKKYLIEHNSRLG